MNITYVLYHINHIFL